MTTQCTYCGRTGHRASQCDWPRNAALYPAARRSVADATDTAFTADRPFTWLPAAIAREHPLGRAAPQILPHVLQGATW